MSHAQDDHVPDRASLTRFMEGRARTGRDNGARLYIVAMGSLGLPVDVITCGTDGAWRTIEGAQRMKQQLEEQMPHGPKTTYHIVNGHRA